MIQILSDTVISVNAANAPPATGATSLIVLVKVMERVLPAVSDTVIGMLTRPNELKLAVVDIFIVRLFPDHEKLTVIPGGTDQAEIEATDSLNVRVSFEGVPIFTDPSEVP